MEPNGSKKTEYICWKKIKQTVKKAIAMVYNLLYPFCYILGLHVIKTGQHVKNFFMLLFEKGLLKATCFIGYFPVRGVVKVFDAARKEGRRIKEGFAIAKSRVATACDCGTKSKMSTILMLPVCAVRRHFGLIAGVGKFALSTFAVALLVFTVQFWTGNKTFALAVEYDGETLGYVSDESVFDAATDMANKKIMNPDNTFTFERVPNLTLKMVNTQELLDESDICDRIMSTSSDSFAELSGIYIDGEFVGAIKSRKAFDSLIEKRLDEFIDKEEEVSILEEIKIVKGLYPITNLKKIVSENNAEKEDIAVVSNFNYGFDKAETMNSIIEEKTTVKAVKEVQYSKVVEFKHDVVETDTLFVGESKIKTKGEDGEKKITEEHVFINGEKISEEITSEETIKEVVNKVELKGIKKLDDVKPGDNGSGIASGTLTWPVPSCRTVWSQFGNRWNRQHKGIDISGSGILNQPVVAADGGKVVEIATGWGSGYGNSILVDHGNGLVTRYSHLNSINVISGQRVSRGQLIGRVGNTGNSTGAHLHFEIIQNGSVVNPLNFY